MAMIVVEGCDGAGKTTLVRNLVEEFGLTIGERGVADRDKLYTVTRTDTYSALAQAVKGDAPPKVWDRLFYSEMVYAPVTNGGRPCEFQTYEQEFVAEVLEALACPVILCVPPFAVVEGNITQAKQMAGVNENIRAIYRHYNTGYDDDMDNSLRWPSTTVRYDYTGTMEESPDFPYVTAYQLRNNIGAYLELRKVRETSAELPATSS